MTGRILEESPQALDDAAKVLNDGGIMIVPSRTNYALICDAKNADAIERVFTAKRRTKFGPLTLAISSIAATKDYVAFPETFGIAQLQEIWPDEVSFIFDLTYPFPPKMTMGAKTVAVMRQHDCALNRLLDVYDRPVALTSANLSGQGNIVVTREKAIEDLSTEVDLVLVNDRTDEVADVTADGLNPSNTIVDFTFGTPYLVRNGAMAAKDLLPWIPDLVMDTELYKEALAKRLQTTGA
jgi:L-threonylcarbamoyladenylate synthase